MSHNGESLESPQLPESAESLDQLAELEVKIRRAVELLQASRAEKEMLSRENAHFRRQLAEQQHALGPLQERVARLERERGGMQTRLQKLLEQVDSLLEAGLDAG